MVMNSTVRVKWNEAQNVRGLLLGYKVPDHQTRQELLSPAPGPLSGIQQKVSVRSVCRANSAAMWPLKTLQVPQFSRKPSVLHLVHVWTRSSDQVFSGKLRNIFGAQVMLELQANTSTCLHPSDPHPEAGTPDRAGPEVSGKAAPRGSP